MNKEEALYNPDAGETIKTALKEKRISQIKLADSLEISTKQIQNYQKGYFPKFNTKNIQKMDEILGTDIYSAVYKREQEREIKVLNDVGEEDLRIAVRRLAEATDRHSIIDERNSRNIERLLDLLALKYEKEAEEADPSLPIPGESGGVSLEDEKRNRHNRPASKSGVNHSK